MSELNKNKIVLKPIEIPVDFTELITLQPLITQIEVYELLKKNLDNYRWNYFMSHCKTASEVLKTIPTDQHKEYFENTFDFQYSNKNPKNLAEYFKQRYTFVSRYNETHNNRLYKSGEKYYEEKQDIIIDTVSRRLIFITFDLNHNHQRYDCDIIYHYNKEKHHLNIEFQWSYVPWYSNTSPPIFFSHYYTFDLNTNHIIYFNNSERKS